jgi:YGGT family
MAIDQVDRTVVTQEPTATAGERTVSTESRHIAAAGPGASEMSRRIIILVFGLIQVVIGARIVLLLLDAREANGLVSGILNISQLFVAPFDGILRTDSLKAAGSVLDVTAIVAFVGITIIELIVLWAVGVFRREPATA